MNRTGSTPFQSLKHLLPDYRRAHWTRHFSDRAELRGFDGALLPEIWESDEWVPSYDDRFEIRHLVPGDGLWEVVVDFTIDPDRPYLISVAWKPAEFAA